MENGATALAAHPHAAVQIELSGVLFLWTGRGLFPRPAGTLCFQGPSGCCAGGRGTEGSRAKGPLTFGGPWWGDIHCLLPVSSTRPDPDPAPVSTSHVCVPRATSTLTAPPTLPWPGWPRPGKLGWGVPAEESPLWRGRGSPPFAHRPGWAAVGGQQSARGSRRPPARPASGRH